MKINTNLPANLRALFGLLRILTLILAVFWVLVLSYNTWIQGRTGHDARLMATVGEISLPIAPGSLSLSSDTATPGSLVLPAVRGTLQVDLCSADMALVSALRQTIIPAMALLIIFSYVQFSALRQLCANLERGDVFNDENLRLVRRIGVVLIGYSLLGLGLEFWASHALGSYFGQHVVLRGLATNLPFTTGSGTLWFGMSSGLLTNTGALVIGSLVLAVAEAFRQGLKLKAENDLTV